MLQKKIAALQAENMALRSRTGTGGQGGSSGHQRPAALRSRIGTCGEGGSSGQQRPPAAPKSQGGGKPEKKCPHGRRECRCVECGGASICEHNREKSKCVECGGASICEHNRRKSQCRECGGSSICEHKRQKGQCRECRGSCFCARKAAEGPVHPLTPIPHQTQITPPSPIPLTRAAESAAPAVSQYRSP